MFEVPEWAECSVASVPGLPVCLRAVTKMVTVMSAAEAEVDFHSLGTCNRHVEVIEAHLSERSELPPITVSRVEFPDFMLEMLGAPGH